MPNASRRLALRSSPRPAYTALAAITIALVIAIPAWAEKPSADAQRAEGLIIFKQHLRQLLAHRCVNCHGSDEPESEFDLTTREGLLKGGSSGKAVTPGDPQHSPLVKLIAHEAEPHMPEEGDRLTAAEVARVVRWIELGAPYDKPLVDETTADTPWTERVVPDSARQFWSFQPLQNVEPPQVKNPSWCRTPIDRFILARLETDGLTPAPPANKVKLIRRAALDLTGIPPTPEEVAAFLADESPDAYERLVERLLASPRYGERWGRHWLDVARFAESHGFEQDYDREHAYHFRDFVIRALNDDMPYDRFVRWQLAGDELAPDDPLAMMATGFLGAGVFPTQITANEVERTRYDALDDMAATTGTAMLGLTIGCARCHDHKFDPIPQGDYYRFIATFSTTVRSNIDLDLDPEATRAARAEFAKTHAPIVAARDKFEAEKLPEQFRQWEADVWSAHHADWQVLDTTSHTSQGGATFTKQPDGSLLAGGENPKHDVYTFVVHTHARGITALRLEALADPSLNQNGPGRAGNGNFALCDLRVTAAPLDGSASPQPVRLTKPTATFEQNGLPAAAAIDDDPNSAWAVDPQFGKDHTLALATDGHIGFEGGAVLTFTLTFSNYDQHAIGRPRLSLTTVARPLEADGVFVPPQIARALDTPRDQRTEQETAAALAWYRTIDPQWQQLDQRVRDSLARGPASKRTKVMVCSEGVPPIRHHTQGADFFEQTYFLRRGNCDQKDGVAPQCFLQILTPSPEAASDWRVAPPEGSRTSYRRTALANWISDAEQGAGHLLARVIVNRLWQHHFGRGIVATPSDFGTQGQRPTHPELLDWLASDLIRGGWRLKRLHRLMMTSAVYMQSTARDANNAAIDPDNRRWWRCTPRRLEAEAIRDSMLAVSGTLDARMFGPGTLDEGHNRRSIYFMIKRSRLIPVMQIFDAPEPIVSVGDRPSTTVAPQALLLMNNPHVHRYAQNFARRLAPAAEKSAADAVRQGYLLATSRPPNQAELADALAFIDQQSQSYTEASKADAKQMALTDFSQVLFSLNEFVYVE